MGARRMEIEKKRLGWLALKHKGRSNGFTLVELLVVLALTGIVTALIYKTFTAQQQVYVVEEQVVAMQQDIRAAMDIMAREIRMAGYDPKGSLAVAGLAGIVSAQDSSLQVRIDLNGNGACQNSSNDPSELITYSLTGEGDLGRESWNGGAQAVAENVEMLNFVYLDGNNNVLPTPVSAENLPLIRSIEISIVVRSDKMDKNFKNTATYRNLRGTSIFTALGDGYRRRILASTIKCRNMGI